LERAGAGRAPNGADYRLIQDAEGRPVVERTHNGERDLVVGGYRGDVFRSRDDALLWARTDGRYEMRRGEAIYCRPYVA
jgi:hypothetical protein